MTLNVTISLYFTHLVSRLPYSSPDQLYKPSVFSVRGEYITGKNHGGTSWRLAMTKVKDLTKILISEKGLPLVKQFSALAEHLSHLGVLRPGPPSAEILI